MSLTVITSMSLTVITREDVCIDMCVDMCVGMRIGMLVVSRVRARRSTDINYSILVMAY